MDSVTLSPQEALATWSQLHREDRRQLLEQTAHVHDVPHLPITTTEPLAHLKEDAHAGETQLILQPRHAGHAFTVLTVDDETVSADGVATAVYAPLPEGLSPAIAAVLHLDHVIEHTVVTLTSPLEHDHLRGAAVSAEGFDPEVKVEQPTCHDCGDEILSDKIGLRLLVCAKVYGLRPTALRPSDPDGVVECGLEALPRSA